MDAAPEVLVLIQRKTATALTRIKVGETGRHTFLPTLFRSVQSSIFLMLFACAAAFI